MLHLTLRRSLARATPLTSSASIFNRSLFASSRLLPSQTFKKFISTERITPTAENDLLVNQRKLRPMSPHLTIYKKQLTFNMSGAHRILGICMAGTFYVGLISYAVLPLIGFPFSMHDVAALVSAAPESVKTAAKLVCAFPFTFHMLNGFRHLLWDTGRGLSIKGVYATGYTVLALMCVASFGLVFGK